jgi:uncharacterized protein YecA (UPF0149 family)
MSDVKSPASSAIPLVLIAAILGGGLWYCGEANVFPHAKAAAVAVGFGLLGGLFAMLAKGQASVVGAANSAGEAQTDIANKIASSIEKSQTSVTSELLKAQKEIGAFAGQLVTANQSSQKTLSDFVSGLKQVMTESQQSMAKSLADHATKVGSLGGAFHEQAVSAFTSHRNMLQSALEEIQKNSEAWRARFDSSINAHAASIEKSNKGLSDHLERIALIGRDIDKLLQVQKSIDTTLENVAKTEDFKKTMGRLAEHLENAERVIKEATKPRAIRLVESHGD